MLSTFALFHSANCLTGREDYDYSHSSMNTLETWKKCLEDSQKTLEQFVSEPGTFSKLEQFTKLIVDTFKNGGVVYSCGNGGSHCDAMHFAEEWTGRYRKDRKPMGALALGDASHLTCVANDFGFEYIFERQILALGRKGDCLLLFSTSGKSPNQHLAAHAARGKGMKTIALLGRDGGPLKEMVDLAIVVPATTSDRVQEVHIKLVHSVIESVERLLFPELYQD